jgi:cytochrome oxidase Cu insertion factor (SCO1/SenC/PrrC family)
VGAATEQLKGTEMMRKTALLLTLILVLSGLAITASAALNPGTAAPDFTLPTSTGEKLTLSQFKGQVVILAFWKSD